MWKNLLTPNAHKIGLGAAGIGQAYGAFPGQAPLKVETLRSMLDLIRSRGSAIVDTARAYGRSSSMLGAAGVNGLKVVSKLKVSEIIGGSEADIKSLIEAEKRRLSSHELYGLLIHDHETLFSSSGRKIFELLKSLKPAHNIVKLGVSVYSPCDLDRLFCSISPEIVQAPINVLDRRFEESGWLDKFACVGVECHARSVFLQGFLLANLDELPDTLSKWKDILAQFQRTTRELNITPLEACLSYPISLNSIRSVLVGATSIKELSDILRACENKTIFHQYLEHTGDISCLIDPRKWRAV